MALWLTALIAAATTLVLMPVVMAYARLAGLIDYPDPRRLHAEAIVRGGGVAVVVAALLAGWVGGAAWTPVELLLICALAGIGFWDDHRSPPAWLRGLLQLLLAGIYFFNFDVPWIWLPALVLAAAWWINLFNFMDGANGVAAVQGGMLAVLMALLAWHLDLPEVMAAAVALAAGLGVFLPFNFPRARIFLGDVGSYGVAAVLLVVGYRLASSSPAAGVVVVLGGAPFVVDATLTLLRRVIAGRRWYNPHREHVYQRLIAGGWSPARVVGALAAVHLLLIYPLAAWAVFQPGRAWLALGLGYAIVTGAWLLLYEQTARKT